MPSVSGTSLKTPRGVNDAGHIAFLAALADGRFAVIRADPVGGAPFPRFSRAAQQNPAHILLGGTSPAFSEFYTGPRADTLIDLAMNRLRQRNDAPNGSPSAEPMTAAHSSDDFFSRVNDFFKPDRSTNPKFLDNVIGSAYADEASTDVDPSNWRIHGNSHCRNSLELAEI